MQTLKQDGLLVNSLTALFQDAGNQFSLKRKDQIRSSEYLVSRYMKEGFGFVSKTLPSFGKHFDVCLQEGKYSLFHGFKTPRRGIFPLFLKGLIQYVFEDNGTLKDDADIDIIRFIRQLSFMFYKTEGDYPEVLVNECIERFIKTDENLPEYVDCSPENYGYLSAAQAVVSDIFDGFEYGDILPIPGPGQSADHREGHLKYQPLIKYQKLHEAFPYYKYFYCSTRHLLDRVRSYRALPVHAESVSVLACVPKDSRGPRLICMEPPEFMWIQQGLGRAMVRWLENHYITKGQINFSDQTINGALALLGSETQEWATLDMKDASDRISRDLVSFLFDGVPKLRDALLSATTDYVLTPSGAIRKRKYASMGSALCFPVMSVVHYALGIGVLMHHSNRSRRALAKDLFVYGDDIIVKTEYAKYLLETFEKFGLKFNPIKCCIKGYFRESCGVDAYKGKTVTPLRVKKLTLSEKDGTSIQSALAVFHGLFVRGLWSTAKVYQDWIVQSVGDLPHVTDRSSALGWIVPAHHVEEANVNLPQRFDKHLQCPSYRVRVIASRSSNEDIGDWERCIRALNHKRVGDASLFTPRSSVVMRWKRVPLSCL